jgi:hypothetical protein
MRDARCEMQIMRMKGKGIREEKETGDGMTKGELDSTCKNENKKKHQSIRRSRSGRSGGMLLYKGRWWQKRRIRGEYEGRERKEAVRHELTKLMAVDYSGDGVMRRGGKARRR